MPHCARWGPSSPPKKGGRAPSPIFGPFLLYQTARCMKMPLGMKVGLSPGDIVLDGDPAPPPLKVHSSPIFGQCPLWTNGWMDYAIVCHFVWRYASSQVTLCSVGTQLPQRKWHIHPTQFLTLVYCGQTVTHLSY